MLSGVCKRNADKYGCKVFVFWIISKCLKFLENFVYFASNLTRVSITKMQQNETLQLFVVITTSQRAKTAQPLI